MSSAEKVEITGTKVADCCYGENRWQSPAALFSTGSADPLALERFEVILGTAPSVINLRDVSRLLQTITHIAAVYDVNAGIVPKIAVGCKHGNPCGAAIGSDPADVIRNMAIGDPLALFGGIVMTNFIITAGSAKIMLSAGGKRVLDGVVAPDFEPAAIDELKRKNERCRLYKNPALATLDVQSLDSSTMIIPVRGGFLQQPNYTFVLDMRCPNFRQYGPLSENARHDILLAWAVGSTSNSNTITLVKNGTLIGNGVGQQDRVGGCDLAISRARRSVHDTKDTVAYSDSFFPFPDGPEHLAKAGIGTILATSGSINDDKVREFCAQNNVTLILLPDAEARGFFGH